MNYRTSRHFSSLVGLTLALLGAVACSEDAADKADVLLQDSAQDTAPDTVGTSDQATADAEPWAMPELDPALCGALPALDWLGATAGYSPVQSATATGATQAQLTAVRTQDKNWYLLTLLQSAPYRTALGQHPATAALSSSRAAALYGLTATCKGDAACAASQLGWDAAAIDAAVTAASAALAPTDLVSAHLRPSGAWAIHHALTDDALLTLALRDTLQHVQRVFADTEANRADLPDAATAVAAAHPAGGKPNEALAQILFFEPVLWLALDGLHYRDRDQAGWYEPLTTGENAAALAAIQTTDWDQWRFGLILVPGWGPNDLQTPLSEMGQEHCDLAAARWKAKVAPFVLVSGGHVHPDNTPYAEALEMKKYLMSAHGLPASAIIVDPHARHTTTNLRNAGRLAFRMGIPVAKPLLSTTDLLQSFYILNLATRCKEELGYLPWRLMARLGDYDNCWLPSAENLYIDARDERDP
jgi:hypothetical protein